MSDEVEISELYAKMIRVGSLPLNVDTVIRPILGTVYTWILCSILKVPRALTIIILLLALLIIIVISSRYKPKIRPPYYTGKYIRIRSFEKS